jgi:anti-sigma regulatory factor (Ser/Thr protein kinase)
MIEIRVEDDGPGMPVGEAREIAVEELPESGMGLAIIEALVDEVEIGPGAGGRGTSVLMRRALQQARLEQPD